MADNIKVAVRVRPLLQKERSNGLSLLWAVKDKSISSVESSSSENYIFDSVYDHMDTNEELYGELCSPIIKSAMAGFHGTIFAYGQSGSGKTHTMTGNKMQPGVIDMAVDEIFEIIESEAERKEFLLRISYMEIYTERIYDLFDDAEKTLKIQEDVNHQITVVNLTEQIVNSRQQLLQWMIRGETKRKFAETKANDRSSRSHVILRVIVESRLKGDVDAVMVSHLNFVDLAGSEKAADNSGDRFREGCAINRSLLTLSQVISKLSEGVSNAYIGYRDSKLTRILQNALGGNSNTLIICTIAPASMEESVSTLRFASRAKTIKNKPIINEVLSDSALLKKYAMQIKKLQRLVDETGVHGIKIEKEDLEKQLQEKEIYQKEQEELIAKLRTMIVVSVAHKDNTTKQRKQRRETWCGPKIRKSSVFPDFGSSRTPFDFLDSSKLSTTQQELPHAKRHQSFQIVEEEEDITFTEVPNSLLAAEDDESIFVAPEVPRRSFVTNTRRSGRRSEPEQSRNRNSNEEVEKLQRENKDLLGENARLGERVRELESHSERLEGEVGGVRGRLQQMTEDMALQSMELDRALGIARHDMSLRDLQEFHRLEKEDLEEQIEKLSKKKNDLESQMVPADAQYVKQLEQELASNYDKVVDLTKSNKDMQAKIAKLEKNLSQSQGEVDRKLGVNDDYISMLEKQVNTSQEKLKHYERMSVGALPVGGVQVSSTLEATIEGLLKDKAKMEEMLNAKTEEINDISDEKVELRKSLDNKISEVESLAEEKKSLEETVEKQTSEDVVSQLEARLRELEKEKAHDTERYEQEREVLEKILQEKDGELEAMVKSLEMLTTESAKQGELIDEVKALNEQTLSEKVSLEEQILLAKSELQTLLAEKMDMEDRVNELQVVAQEKETLSAKLEERTKELEDLRAQRVEVPSEDKRRSKRVSQSVSMLSVDADITVSNIDISMRMSKGPLSLADELAAASKPMSLADELAGVNQPMSLADELAGASQPMSLADELSVSEPLSLSDELAQASNAKQSPNEPAKIDQTEKVESINQELQTSFDNQTCDHSEIEQQLKEKCEEIETMMSKLKDLESELTKKESDLESLTKVKGKLEGELEEKQEELETFSDEMLRLQELVDELKEGKTSADHALREQKEALEDQQVQTRQLQQQLEEKLAVEEQKSSVQLVGQESQCEQHLLEEKEPTGELKTTVHFVDQEAQCELLSSEASEAEKSVCQSKNDVVEETESIDETTEIVFEEKDVETGNTKTETILLEEHHKMIHSLQVEIANTKDEVQKALDEKADIDSKLQEMQANAGETSFSREHVESLIVKVTDLEEAVELKEKEIEELKQQSEGKAAEDPGEMKDTESKAKEEDLLQKIRELEETNKQQVELYDTVKRELEERETLISKLQRASKCEKEVSFAEKEIVIPESCDDEDDKGEGRHCNDVGQDSEEEISFMTKPADVKPVQDVDTVPEEASLAGVQKLEELELRIKELEETIEEKQNQIEKAKVDYEEQGEKLLQLQNIHEEKLEIASDLESKLENAQKITQEKESEIEKLTNEIQTQVNKITELQQQLQTTEEMSNEKLSQVTDLEQKIEVLEQHVEQKVDELASAQENVQQLKEELQSSCSSVEAKQEEIREMVSKLENTEAVAVKKEEEIENSKKLNTELAETLVKYEKEIITKSRELSELNSKIDHLEFCMAENESESGESSSALEDLKAKMNTLRGDIESREAEVKELTDKVSKLEKDLEEKELDVETKSKQMEETIDELAQVKVELDVKVKEAALLEERVNEVEEQLNQQEVEFEKIKEAGMAKIGELTEENYDLQDKVTDLEKCLAGKEAEIVEISEQIEQIMEEKLQEVRNEVHSKESELRAAIEKVTTLEEAVRDKDNEIEHVMSEKLKLEKGGEEMMRLVQEKHDLEEKLREKSSEVVGLTEEKTQLELDLAHKTGDLQVMVDCKNKQDVDLEEKITEIENLSNEILKLEDAVVEKTQEFELLQEEKNSSESLLKEKSTLLEDLGQKMNEFENLFQEKSDEVDQCRLEITELEKALAEEREELEKVKASRKAEVTAPQDPQPQQRDPVPQETTETPTQKALLFQLFMKLNKSGKSDLSGLIDTLYKEGHEKHANALREQDVKLAKEKVEVDRRIGILERELEKKEKKLKEKEEIEDEVCKKMMETQEEMSMVKEEMETVREEMKKVELSKVDLKLEVHYLGNKLKEEQDNFSQRKTALEEEIEYKEEIITKLKGEMRKLQRDQDMSYVAPAAPEPALAPAARTVSSRSGIIDNYKVCMLEGEKKELQLSIKELRQRIQTYLVEIKELKEQNKELKMSAKPLDDKENGSATPKAKAAEKAAASPADFNLDFMKKRRSLTYEDIKKMAAPYKERKSSVLSPIKDSSKVNEMGPSASSLLSSGRLSQRRSVSREGTENCKVQ